MLLVALAVALAAPAPAAGPCDPEADFHAFARGQARRDHAERPYPLSPGVLTVWEDGRVEVAR